MPVNYTFLADIATETEPPQDGILSRTIVNNSSIKGVLFGFSAGQELSEHTAAMPALLYIAKGEGELTLGEDHHAAKPGSWVYMPPNLKHSVKAHTGLVMLLVLIKGAIPATDS